jgi:hypothetical protein
VNLKHKLAHNINQAGLHHSMKNPSFLHINHNQSQLKNVICSYGNSSSSPAFQKDINAEMIIPTQMKYEKTKIEVPTSNNTQPVTTPSSLN